MTPEQQERFEAKVAKGPGCWEWQASVYGGYGQFAINRRPKKAHRLAYELWVGKIPEGLYVCHHCDNKTCCNPEHLFVGTQFDNMQDCARKGRVKITSKISREDAETIREWAPCNKQGDLAEAFSIGQQQISRIVRRTRWV